MKKILSIFIFACFFSSIYAEESGFFIGGGVGFQSVSREAKNSILGFTTASKDEAKNYGLSVLLGYKNIFEGGKTGSRIYFNYDYNPIKIEGSNETSGYNVYGLNLDYLYNFIQHESSSTGFAVGINLGAVQWDKQIILSEKETSTFYSAINLGLRFASMSGSEVEIYGKVPLNKSKIEYANNPNTSMDIKQSYNVGFRFIYTF